MPALYRADVRASAVTAFHQPPPVVMLTSDVDDMAELCGDRATLVAL
jgi:hypothetical protein